MLNVPTLAHIYSGLAPISNTGDSPSFGNGLFGGAWLGGGLSGCSGLFALSGSFGSMNETNAIDEIDRTDPRTG
jgi:hypothetical protein